MLIYLNDIADCDLPWNQQFIISVDGPNINKCICRAFHKALQEKANDGLIELIACTLHVVHNAFRKFVTSLEFGDMVDQLAYDLHEMN